MNKENCALKLVDEDKRISSNKISLIYSDSFRFRIIEVTGTKAAVLGVPTVGRYLSICTALHPKTSTVENPPSPSAPQKTEQIFGEL